MFLYFIMMVHWLSSHKPAETRIIFLFEASVGRGEWCHQQCRRVGVAWTSLDGRPLFLINWVKCQWEHHFSCTLFRWRKVRDVLVWNVNQDIVFAHKTWTKDECTESIRYMRGCNELTVCAWSCLGCTCCTAVRVAGMYYERTVVPYERTVVP